jgi:hypothetical protein
MEALAHFFEGKFQWVHAQFLCQNVKNKEFYSSLSTNMHNHIRKEKKPLICSMKHGVQLPNANHAHT